MALRKRKIIGNLSDALGATVDNGQITFKLTSPLSYTSDYVVVDKEVYTVTSASGVIDVELWCDDDSLTPVNYTMSFPIEDDETALTTHSVEISLAYEDGSDKDIGTLIAESQPPPSDVPTFVWASLIDSRIGNGDIVMIVGTAHTITEDNAGKTIVTTNGSAVTITVPDALPVGFQCIVSQNGDGQVEFTSSDATVRNRQSHDKIAGKYGLVTILKIDTAEFRLQGDTAS